MAQLHDKVRAICHHLKLHPLSAVADERVKNELVQRIKHLPSPEQILAMGASEVKELHTRTSKLMLEIEASENARTHDGYVHSIINKGLPPRMKTILPAKNWYAKALADKK